MSSEDLIREAQDPSTSPARLAELAQIDRSTWAAIVFNPAAYDGLLQWLGERGDPTVNAALTARASHAATLQAPSAPAAAPAAPVPPVVPPVVPAPAATDPVAQPVVPAEPVAEPVAEPTVSLPVSEPVAETPPYSAPEPTVAFPTPEPSQYTAPEPTAVQPSYSAQQAAYPTQPQAGTGYPAEYPTQATAGFGAVPPGVDGQGTPPGGDGDKGNGKQLGIVIGMVVVIIALIGGAAFGATKVFGGDDDKVSASDTSTSAAPEPSDSPSADDETVPAPSGTSDAPSGASSEFCSTMKDIQDSSMDLLGGDGGTPDLDSLQQLAADMTAKYKTLEQTAPDELKADIKTMSAYFDLLENPSADAASKMSESIADYSKAAQNVGVYYAQNCL